MRETRLSGSEGGAGFIPVPTPIMGSKCSRHALVPGIGKENERGSASISVPKGHL